jgi:hypothetical protein
MGPEGSLPSSKHPSIFSAGSILSPLTHRISLRYILILRSHLRPDLNSVHVKSKQDRQCTCNVTLRRVHATTVAVERQ